MSAADSAADREGVDMPNPVAAAPSAWESLRAMWIFSILRIAVFLALWGLLWVARVPGFLAAVIALALSIPLSYILLRKPREQLATNLDRRVQARQFKAAQLDTRLSGDSERDS